MSGSNAVARSAAGQLATAGAILGGWLFMTLGVALLTTPKVWALSFGLLLLSLAGWRLCWTIAREGLYRLTREPPHA